MPLFLPVLACMSVKTPHRPALPPTEPTLSEVRVPVEVTGSFQGTISNYDSAFGLWYQAELKGELHGDLLTIEVGEITMESAPHCPGPTGLRHVLGWELALGHTWNDRWSTTQEQSHTWWEPLVVEAGEGQVLAEGGTMTFFVPKDRPIEDYWPVLSLVDSDDPPGTPDPRPIGSYHAHGCGLFNSLAKQPIGDEYVAVAGACD